MSYRKRPRLGLHCTIMLLASSGWQCTAPAASNSMPASATVDALVAAQDALADAADTAVGAETAVAQQDGAGTQDFVAAADGQPGSDQPGSDQLGSDQLGSPDAGGCQTAAQCPAPANPSCAPASCLNGVCGSSPVPDGKACASGSACQSAICLGACRSIPTRS